ncbi:preprotein translocase subunit SecY [Candidatus Peregrinibacteria bacterium]|jgi:preprotein translocase subunit SecY|nr:preprotein translocase subunit SecY [Candidatus Peregrinibacteria bacterium]
MNYLHQIWNTPTLRKKILFTLMILIIFRMVAHITIPGVDASGIQSVFEQNALLGVFSALTGGSMESFSIVLMGLAPYINASIIIQLMTVVIPHLEQLSKEGEEGRKKLNKYTRWLTLPLAFLQSYGMIILLNNSALASGSPLLDTSSFVNMLPVMISITAGTIFAMWLGEVISEKGIGNGISLLIFAGIVSAIPPIFGRILGVSQYDPSKLPAFFGFCIFTLLLLVLIALFTEAYRNVPITYASRGSQAQKSALPLRLNQAGMIPIIFAIAMITFPALIAQIMSTAESEGAKNVASWINTYLNTANPGYVYILLYFFLVLGFAYFYVSIVFKPEQVAENIQKRGGFIPGIRPGPETADYLDKTSMNLTFWGGTFLAGIAILPLLFTKYTSLQASDLIITGSGLIIVVGVVLELIRQVNAQLVAHDYDKI